MYFGTVPNCRPGVRSRLQRTRSLHGLVHSSYPSPRIAGPVQAMENPTSPMRWTTPTQTHPLGPNHTAVKPTITTEPPHVRIRPLTRPGNTTRPILWTSLNSLTQLHDNHFALGTNNTTESPHVRLRPLIDRDCSQNSNATAPELRKPLAKTPKHPRITDRCFIISEFTTKLP